MFRFLFRNPKAAEDWHAHLRRNPNRQKMLKCLLSDISFSDKRTILNVFLQACVENRQKWKLPQDPKKLAYKKQSKLLWLESKLDEAGHIKMAQFIRFALYNEEDNESDMDWCSRIIRADVKARWLVQREAYLIEEVQALHKSLSLLPLNADEAVCAAAATQAEFKLKMYEKEYRLLDNAYGPTRNTSGSLKPVSLYQQLDEPMKRAGRTSQIGIYPNGCAATVLAVGGAVDGVAGAVKRREAIRTGNGSMVIVRVPVGAVCVQRDLGKW